MQPLASAHRVAWQRIAGRRRRHRKLSAATTMAIKAKRNRYKARGGVNVNEININK